jgi:bifunctional DNA-binding transcriptional regulator/antitoxin component of YhaV-PrlF toxin-antitoxin module
MREIRIVGETTLTGKNQISLPSRGVRQLNWTKGDRLIVETLDGIMVLMRCPSNWTETLAGRMTHVFGPHEETLHWLEEERRSWGDA